MLPPMANWVKEAKVGRTGANKDSEYMQIHKLHTGIDPLSKGLH